MEMSLNTSKLQTNFFFFLILFLNQNPTIKINGPPHEDGPKPNTTYLFAWKAWSNLTCFSLKLPAILMVVGITVKCLLKAKLGLTTHQVVHTLIMIGSKI